MKDLISKLTKKAILPLAVGGSLLLSGCWGEEEKIAPQKEENKIEEEKELYKFFNDGMISPDNLSADNQYCIFPCQLDSTNENNDLIVFDISTKRAKRLTDTPEINENDLCIFDDYVAFFGEFKRGNLHLRNVYIANYKTGETKEIASYNYDAIKKKYISFVDEGKKIKLIDTPPAYIHENPLYEDKE